MKLSGENDSAIYVQSAYDYHAWQYGFVNRMMPWQEAWSQAENGLFLPWRLPVSKPLVLPQSKKPVPFEDVEIGRLHHGTTDPKSAEFNNLADWHAAGSVIEVRVPGCCSDLPIPARTRYGVTLIKQRRLRWRKARRSGLSRISPEIRTRQSLSLTSGITGTSRHRMSVSSKAIRF